MGNERNNTTESAAQSRDRQVKRIWRRFLLLIPLIAVLAHRSADELRVGFSTTNYHVFRGYVCAHKAGMEVEGLGSKTKYYFWPNAFLREFAGLIVGQWKPIVQTYCIIGFVHLFTISALTLV